MKKLILALTLTFLLAVSASAGFAFKITGNAITKYGNSSKTDFYVSIQGHMDTVNTGKHVAVNIHDTIKHFDSTSYNGMVSYLKTLSVPLYGMAKECTLIVIIKRAGFLIDSSYYSPSKNDSFSLSTNLIGLAIQCKITEKPPAVSITTPANPLIKSPVSLQWVANDTVAITSQSLWLSHNNGPFIEIDTLTGGETNTFTKTFFNSDLGSNRIMIKAWNADSCASAISNPFTVTTTMPTVSISTLSDTVAIKTTKQITWAASALSGVKSQSIKIGNAVLPLTTSPYSWTPTSPGTDTIKIIVTDSADQVSTSTGVVFTVKASAPSVSITTKPDTIIVKTAKQITWTTSASAGIKSQSIKIGSSIYPVSGQTYSWTPTLPGIDTVKIIVVDSVGQVDTSAEVVFTVINRLPTNSLKQHKLNMPYHIKINNQILGIQIQKGFPYSLVMINAQGKLIFKGIFNTPNLKIPYSGEFFIQINKITSKIFLY